MATDVDSEIEPKVTVKAVSTLYLTAMLTTTMRYSFDNVGARV